MPKLVKAKQKRKLLILACGRSGTQYISKVWKKAGLDFGHEHVLSDGCVSMYFCLPHADISAFNTSNKHAVHPNEYREDFEFEHIWHQVRDPLKAIDSMAKAFNSTVRRWTQDHMGIDAGNAYKRQCSIEDKYLWAMRYYLQGNELMAQQAQLTYRLESLQNIWWAPLCDKLGLGLPLFPNVSSTTNRGLRFAFKSKEQAAEIRETLYDTSWETLKRVDKTLAGEIRERTREWGYS